MVISIKLTHYDKCEGGREHPFYIGEEPNWISRNKPLPNQAKIIGIGSLSGSLYCGNTSLVRISPRFERNWESLSLGERIFFVFGNKVFGDGTVVEVKQSHQIA